jgi:hypothetical protein
MLARPRGLVGPTTGVPDRLAQATSSFTLPQLGYLAAKPLVSLEPAFLELPLLSVPAPRPVSPHRVQMASAAPRAKAVTVTSIRPKLAAILLS